jgi:hypothetical protein
VFSLDDFFLDMAVVERILETDIFKFVGITGFIFDGDVAITESLIARGFAGIGFREEIIRGILAEFADHVV